MSKQKQLVALARTINSFKDENSDAYARLVPDLQFDQKGNVANFTDLSNIMLNNGYVKLQNEFVGALLNKIGLSLIQRTASANPLSMFKKGALPKGSDVEVLFTNPAIAEDIGVVNDTNQQKLLKTYKPDTKVVYLRTNRGADGLGDVYAVTIAAEDLKRAFQSIENMDNYVMGLVRSLTAGDEIDEFKYTKKIIANAVSQNYIVIDRISSDITTEASLKSLVAKIRSRRLKMTLPSTKNNAYVNFSDSMGNPAVVLSDAEDLCLVITSDLAANIDVGVLAAAFNMEKAEFLGRVLVVDEFDNAGIAAVLCDQSWIQIYDSEKTIEDFRNARTGTTNTFLRARGVFAILPFANAVAFVIDDEDFLPNIVATDITVDDTTVGIGEVHNFRLVPANSTDTITIDETSTGTVEIDNDNKTFKALTAGSLKLQVVGVDVTLETVTAS